LENAHTRSAVGLWRLYFETGHRRGDFLADRMTGSGRQASADCREFSLQTGRSDLVLNGSKVASISPTVAPAVGHDLPFVQWPTLLPFDSRRIESQALSGALC